MRESKKTERTHLPKDVYEEWSESQTVKAGGAKHRQAPENTYEVWVEKRVKKKESGQKTSGVKRRRRASA